MKTITKQIETILTDRIGEHPACSCASCKKMCEHSPCIGTPEQMLALVENGFGDKLSPTMVLTNNGLKQMLAPKGTGSDPLKKRCVFLSVDGLCNLHGLGLKPIEGKFAHHAQTSDEAMEMRTIVAESWNTKMGKFIIDAINGKNC